MTDIDYGIDPVYDERGNNYLDLEELRCSLPQEEDIDGLEAEPESVYAECVPGPPEHEWYHGTLDRKKAEELLWRRSEPGTYLVRESDRKPGSYSLSFVGVTGISHFRIISIYGQYYIGGRQFSSLRDLIGYYTSSSCLLENEFLKYPLAADGPVVSRRRLIAINARTAVDHPDELSFCHGDVLTAEDEREAGWLWCTLERNQTSGLVPLVYLREVTNLDPYAGREWFFNLLNKQQANEYLLANGAFGSFLIRPSESSVGDYSISLHCGNTIARFRVVKDGWQYAVGGRLYDGMDSIVSHYRHNQLAEGVYMGKPVPKTQEYLLAEAESLTALLSSVNSPRRNTMSQNVADTRLGYMTMKANGHKKWKEYFYTLKESESQLFYFENERARRPKGLIDLSYSGVYDVHRSLHGRENCFTVVVRGYGGSTRYVLCTNTDEKKQLFMGALMPLCQSSQSSSKLQHIRSLTVMVTEALRLPKSYSHPYCVLRLNDVIVARTRAGDSSQHTWDDEFKLVNIPADITTFSITMSNYNRRIKDHHIGNVQISLQELPNRRQIDERYELRGKNEKVTGALRMKLQSQHDVVLPEADYAPLKELILAPDLAAVRLLGDAIRDRRSLVSTLLRVFRHEKGGSVRFLAGIAEGEVKNHEDEPATLFRGNTLASSAIDEYTRETAQPFLQETVKKIVNDIVERNLRCELDPARMEKGDDTNQNAQTLQSIVEEATNIIFSSVNRLPLSLRYIFGLLQAAAGERWPDKPVVKVRVVAGFLFLRFVCLSFVNPRLFNLVTETPSETASRSLTLAAKCLQNLASLVEFGGKEPYMAPLNVFICENKQRMTDFANEVADVSSYSDASANLDKNQTEDLPFHLATLQSICRAHEQDLVKLQKKKNSDILQRLIDAINWVAQREECYN